MTNWDRLIELFNLWSKAFGQYHNSALTLTADSKKLKDDKDEAEAAEVRYLSFRKTCIAGKENGGFDINDKYRE